MSDIKLIKKINDLQKKVNELYKYKKFVELEKNSKDFYEKFEKMNKNNLLLINHIKNQKDIIDLLKQEKNQYKNKLTELNNNGLNFVNKKNFYQLNLKINDLEKMNQELKNTIKNKEEIFLNLKLKLSKIKNNNNKLENLFKSFIENYNNLNNNEEDFSYLEEKTLKTNTTKSSSNIEKKSDEDEINELDDNILL